VAAWTDLSFDYHCQSFPFFHWNFITLYNKNMDMENISKVEHVYVMSRNSMNNE